MYAYIVYVCLCLYVLCIGQGQRVPVVLTFSRSEIPVGEEFIATCTTQLATTGVSFTHEGLFVPTSSRITYSSTGVNMTWTFNPVLVEDQGAYVCFVSTFYLFESSSLPQTLTVIVGKLYM